jgi:hypothetical protein
MVVMPPNSTWDSEVREVDSEDGGGDVRLGCWSFTWADDDRWDDERRWITDGTT